MSDATLRQAIKILQIFHKNDVPLWKINVILDSGILEDLAEADVGKLCWADFRELLGLGVIGKEFSFQVTIDYSKSLHELLLQKSYKVLEEGLMREDSSCKLNDQRDILVRVISFERACLIKDVLCEMRRFGIRPARLEELLALSNSCPHLLSDGRKQIVATGSLYSTKKGFLVPYLRRFPSGELAIDLTPLDEEWGENTSFAGIPIDSDQHRAE